MSCPSATTVPALGLTIPQTMLISVVFPAPLGPSSAKISPRRIVRSTRRSAWKPLAYVLLTPDTDRIGAAASLRVVTAMPRNLGARRRPAPPPDDPAARGVS